MKSFSRRKFLQGSITTCAALTVTSILHGETISAVLASISGRPQPKRSPITNCAEWEGDKPSKLPGARKPKVESVLIYQPEMEWTYSHHQSITFYHNRFYAMWSNGRQNEDTYGQRVLLSTSADFNHWTTPILLAEPGTDKDGNERVLTAGGFHQHEGMLVAYFGDYDYFKNGTRLCAVTKTDVSGWSAIRDIGIPVCPNLGPQRIASGRLLISGNISFPFTDNPSGLSDWKMTGIYPESMAGNIKDDPSEFRVVSKVQAWNANLCEGAFYQTDDGVLHMMLRNVRNPGESHTGRLWITESRDNGTTWSSPVATDFSDTDAKFHFGRLPDGRFYYVGNPIGTGRNPLVLSLSRDGIRFDQHYILGDTHYVMRRTGGSKGGDYGYPTTIIHDKYLYVIVSRQKENIEVLRVALSELSA
jgi:hypothetical protein